MTNIQKELNLVGFHPTKEGIENFNFEILKEVERNELNYWEDFFIIKFGTMFPDGYNKKWNCNKETRKEIEKSLIEERTLKQHDEGNSLFLG